MDRFTELHNEYIDTPDDDILSREDIEDLKVDLRVDIERLYDDYAIQGLEISDIEDILKEFV